MIVIWVKYIIIASMRPVFIPQYINRFLTAEYQSTEALSSISANYHHNLLKGDPEVSIVIPAYNEEKTILQTLASLCNNKTPRSVEIIVVNNNSTDDTERLVKLCGVTCITEPKQGIAQARNAGLAYSTGKYVLNADADTIYPEYWIEQMVTPLASNNDIAITYGPSSFIPIANTGRVTYFFYEYISDLSKLYIKYFKDEAMSVYGFTSGMRREQALMVNGFNFPRGAGEDGYIALKLKENGFGRLYRVTDGRAIAWTTDRRIQIDGGLIKATIKRIKRIFNG